MIADTESASRTGRQLHEQATGVGAAIALTVALLLPLCFNPWGFNVFELPKAALLRLMTGTALVTLALSAATSAVAQERRWRKPPAWLLPFLGMASALILATVFSSNRFVSFWGSHARQQGFLTQCAYLVLFLIAVTCLNTGFRLNRLWSVLVWGSAPVVIYGLLQWVGLDPFQWEVHANSSMISTVGRSNFLGSYLVLVIPLTAAFWLAEDVRKRSRRLLVGSLLIGQFAVLTLTLARSAWIGLAVAACVALLLGLLTNRPAVKRGRAQRWFLVGGLLLSILLLSTSLTRGGPAAKSGSDIQQRLQSLFDLNSGSTAARIAIWQASTKLVKDRPLLGFGPERLDPVFWRVFPPQLVYYQGRDVVVDRAHNLWLDLAITMGFCGVIAFAVMCLVWGRVAWRGLVTSIEPRTRLLWLGIIAAVTGHLVDMEFSFEVTTTAVVFWLLLATGFALSEKQQAGSRRNHERIMVGFRVRREVPTLLLAAILVMAFIVLSISTARLVRADLAFRETQNEQLAMEVRREHAIRAIRLWPMDLRYRVQLAAIETERRDFRSAEVQLLAVDQLTDDDPEIWHLLADLYAQSESVEPSQQEKTEQTYRRMIQLAPNVARYHHGLGLVLAQRGDIEQASHELEQTVKLDATDVSAYRDLTIFYRALGLNAEADTAHFQARYWATRTVE